MQGSEAPSRARVAVVGCGHGNLDTIYADLTCKARAKGWEVSGLDLLIVCGDFQAVRNEHDLNCMSVPRRYRHLGDFHKYYSGQALAPVLTIVIGGNHEASNYLFELYHGGWLAPNIYYLGAAGVIRYGPWRIAGLSGIYDEKHYRNPHHERLPYDREAIRSIYHVREHDVRKLLFVSGHVDVGISHDWPASVELFGDHQRLYESKPHFYESAKKDALGSKPGTQLLDQLRPSYWFSGHMHVKFGANVQHTQATIEENIRTLQVSERLRSDLPVLKNQYTAAMTRTTGAERSRNPMTTFLALGKVGQDPATYLELLELDLHVRTEDKLYYAKTSDGHYDLYYDEEWLAITRAYNDSLVVTDPETLVVPPDRHHIPQVSTDTIACQRSWVHENITAKGLLKIPQNFELHAPRQYGDLTDTQEQPTEYPNAQTAAFAQLLQMENKFAIVKGASDSDSGSDGVVFE